MKPINARALAAKIVFAVVYEKKSLTETLSAYVKASDNEAGLIRHLCFGTLRYWFTLLHYLNALINKPLRNKDNDIQCLLMVGLFQLLYTDIPAYAAVDQTVKALVPLKKPWARGLVNKLLRLSQTRSFKLNDEDLYAHPQWMIEKIKADWPEHWKSMLTANNNHPPLFLRLNKTKIVPSVFLAALDEKEIQSRVIPELPYAVEIINPLPVNQIPGFDEGYFSVQDLTGQKVVDYLSLEKQHRLLDACAAPGSKTTLMLEHFPGIDLTCVDISEKRLIKIKHNIERLHLTQSVSLITADICEPTTWWNHQLFDRILVDAPCSASGVIRRHPDIKVLRQPEDIPALAQKQLQILNTVWSTLQPNGICLYTTCSIFNEENDDVIQQFLSQHSDASVLNIDNNWGIRLKYGQQVLPGDQNRDGFYYALLQKRP